MGQELSEEQAAALASIAGYDVIILQNIRRIRSDQDLLDGFAEGESRMKAIHSRLLHGMSQPLPRAASDVRPDMQSSCFL